MTEHKCINILDVKEFPNYDILYCDPPWENRMLKWFETNAYKLAGVERRGRDISEIFEVLSKLSDPNKPLFIEYSIKGHEEVVKMMSKYGHKLRSKSIHDYFMGGVSRPHILLSFNTDIVVLEKLSGKSLVTNIVKETGAKIVFDPFAGIGFTGSAVQACGAKYIGYEMNPARFKKLISKLK
jgi:hypothetical protein